MGIQTREVNGTMSVEHDLKDYIDSKFTELELHIEMIFGKRECSYPHEQP